METTRRKFTLAGLVCLAAAVPGLRAEAPANFSGIWKQNNDRCEPKRTGEVTLVIDHHDPSFVVEMTSVRDSKPAHQVTQPYTTDGKSGITTGADGDEFHTAVVWRDQALVFTVEEHEDGKILRSTEVWSLIDGGSSLKRVRQGEDGKSQRILIYEKQRDK